MKCPNEVEWYSGRVYKSNQRFTAGLHLNKTACEKQSHSTTCATSAKSETARVLDHQALHPDINFQARFSFRMNNTQNTSSRQYRNGPNFGSFLPNPQKPRIFPVVNNIIFPVTYPQPKHGKRKGHPLSEHLHRSKKQKTETPYPKYTTREQEAAEGLFILSQAPVQHTKVACKHNPPYTIKELDAAETLLQLSQKPVVHLNGPAHYALCQRCYQESS
ncbi:hypothetical protein HYFRA_00003859 [Hymenoscyphus fraxineus]|uniref:Uncharacterized protein n=1 Tax=Hymenoscyphus fraxineus TaxID=746836 RepID=A0A9N9L1I9_9HELO|nr:hypothetical protein HYFRA_00003859 [Hymenoscyphus fraxineus]